MCEARYILHPEVDVILTDIVMHKTAGAGSIA